MSGGAIVLIVFVSASDARDPSTTAMASAARVALGAGATVTVREVQRTPTDDEAIDAGRAQHADAVAEIVWDDAQHLHARVHFHVEGSARWIDRELGFVAADAPAERGRTVGFTIASMLPEHAATEEPTPPPAPSATTLALPAPSTPSAEAPRSLEPPRASRGAVEAAALGSVGVGGYGGGLGASLGVRWNLPASFALRLGVGARGGEVPPAQATSLVVFGAVGLAWSVPSRFVAPFAIGVRTDLLLSRLQLSHLDEDDPSPVRQWRWVGGADALAEWTWFFSQSAGIFAAFGAEAAFGTTSVVVAGNQVAVVPLVRGVSELGVRARF
jgi:hypothetical protein